MKYATDALDLLRDQHRELDDLIDQVEEADSASDRTRLFEQLADALAAHAAIEEQLFYPAVMDDDTCELLYEFTEEHLAVKRVLADMLALDPYDDHWDAKLAVLKEEVRHHAHDEEEGKLFPILERRLRRDERAGLGNDLVARYEELIAEAPRLQVASETRSAAPLEIAM